MVISKIVFIDGTQTKVILGEILSEDEFLIKGISKRDGEPFSVGKRQITMITVVKE